MKIDNENVFDCKNWPSSRPVMIVLVSTFVVVVVAVVVIVVVVAVLAVVLPVPVVQEPC